MPTHDPQPDAPQASFGALFSAVMLPMFLAAIDQTLLAAATPRSARALGGLADSPGIAAGYLLGAPIAAPLYGRMGDRHGRRRVLLVALGVFIAGSVVCATARSMPWLVGARVLQGLGGGGLMVLSQALIGELVSPAERPRYQGYFAAVFTVSSVGGPVIGGFVVNHGDWRWLFLANLPLGLLAAWRVAGLPVPKASPMRDKPYDPAGVVLFTACAASALLWLSLAGHRFPVVSPVSAALAGCAVVTGLVLARQQRRHPFPFLPLDVLRVPGIGWVCLSVVGFSGTMFALVFLLPIYLQAGRNADAATAGLQLLPLTLGMVAGSTLNARFSNRTQSSGRLPPFGLGMAAVALAGLALLPGSHAVTTVAAAMCGMGFGTVMPSAQIATQMLAGRQRLGAASALLAITRSTGAALGTAAFGGMAFALLHVQAGGGESAALRLDGLDPRWVSHAFHVVFGVLALYAAAGAFFAARAPRMDLRSRAVARD